MKTLSKNNRGFTLVELIIVITVIGILATIVSLSYLSTQSRARDTQRQASATVISSSLEKYFEENGEYPSTLKIATASSATVKQLLHLTDLGGLTAPSITGSNTANIWQTGAATAANKLTYTGNTDVSNSCKTGVATTDSCSDYKIQYWNEETKTVTTILSQHTSGTYAGPPLNTPSAPTLSAALSGANVVATASTTCDAGATPQYAFQSRTNDGTWSAFGSWAASATNSTPAIDGVKFGFQVKAQCVTANSTSLESPVSSEATYIDPITAPATPTGLTNNGTGSATTTWSWTATTCPAGTTTYYTIDAGNDYDTTGTQNWWMGWSADQTTTSWGRTTTSQGYMYAAKLKAKCKNVYATSPWSGETAANLVLKPVAAPGNPTGWWYQITGGRTSYEWNWTEPACGLGTASSWQWDAYVGDVNNANGWNLYWVDKGPYYHYWYGFNAPSKQDPGWYTGNGLGISLSGATTPAGIDVYAAITYRCQNPQTLRSATGSRAQSPNYWT